jgi:exosome complex exonuclease DIS3/RRP44
VIQDAIIEADGSKNLFEPHLNFEEMIIGVKEGRYFQGRLAVSRMTSTEASVKVQGLTNDILLVDLEQQNRALNGDIVCIEVDTEDKWIENYKSAEPHNALLEDEQQVEKVKLKLKANPDDSKSEESVSEDEPANPNLVEFINSATDRQVTGRVRGVLKKLNKTYGGSLIAKSDMLVSTLNKFKLFCENYSIPLKEQDKYRVFVPYNV